MAERLNVALLFGGTSSEHDISLRSAANVIDLLSERVDLTLVGITRGGSWLLYGGDATAIADDSWQGHDTTPVCAVPGDGGGLFAIEGGSPVRLPIDVVFPVLHGQGGEDGVTQGLLESCRLPYVGCGVLSSALCTDKDAAHRIVAAAGIRSPRCEVVHPGDGAARIAEVAAACGYPLFVKPARGGSSYGVSKVEGPEQLDEALRLAFGYDEKVAVEEAIVGTEVGCAIMGDAAGELAMGLVDETVVSDGGFFHIHQDHSEGADASTRNSSTRCPALLPPEVMERVRETGTAVWRALGCSGLARVDLFVTERGEVVFNEVNTMPGLTSYSRFPAMMAAAGADMGEVLERLVRSAARTGAR
ncbi:D-alanine--D-alanine ligase family protein [Olsenella uli]|uniref:D-alanine--D-alanine ligase family protein n=1 Tax=Olsenella uli TaxID=133926 RepID=UPI0028E6E2AD|nr:D-alanine--D-alanine ligase family protein [Olsenella uli]